MDKEIRLSDLVKMRHEDAFGAGNSWGFFDWFSRESALPAKSKRLFGLTKAIVKANEKGRKFDPEKTYVFFKNNCPCLGPLYDDLRICDIETGNVIFNVSPKDERGRVTLATEGFGFDNDTQPMAFESRKSLLEWFAGAEFAVEKSGRGAWEARRVA